MGKTTEEDELEILLLVFTELLLTTEELLRLVEITLDDEERDEETIDELELEITTLLDEFPMTPYGLASFEQSESAIQL